MFAFCFIYNSVNRFSDQRPSNMWLACAKYLQLLNSSSKLLHEKYVVLDKFKWLLMEFKFHIYLIKFQQISWLKRLKITKKISIHPRYYQYFWLNTCQNAELSCYQPVLLC